MVKADTSDALRAPQEELGELPVAELQAVSRRFGDRQALRGVSLKIRSGEIRALLGPNGAGKTTLLRVLSGLVQPTTGDVSVEGVKWRDLSEREARRLLGLVPSGDRTFYLRMSGLENLVFFARLHGLSRQAAVHRARACLHEVDLEDDARLSVSAYSHGMQKRLSFARAILVDAPLLMIDEATHDLDPASADRVRQLAIDRASNGSAILWATQRVDEIRGFAHRVTLLHEGLVRFDGSVPQLMARAPGRRHVVHFRETPGQRKSARAEIARSALEGLGSIASPADPEEDYVLLSLLEGATLGRAISALESAGLEVLGCREERSDIESAFLALTGGNSR